MRYINETGRYTYESDPRNERLLFIIHHEYSSGRIWKLDIAFWLSPAPRSERAFHLQLKTRLTPETRLGILWLKDLRHSTSEFPAVVGSIDIYTAVLNAGVRTPTDFDQ